MIKSYFALVKINFKRNFSGVDIEQMNITLRKAVSALKVSQTKVPRTVFYSAFNFSTYYRTQNLAKIHGRLRYDENAHFKTDEMIQEV